MICGQAVYPDLSAQVQCECTSDLAPIAPEFNLAETPMYELPHGQPPNGKRTPVFRQRT